MTIPTISLATLKQVKNAVIGNPTAKLHLAQDANFMRTLTETLNHPALLSNTPQNDAIRIEAAHVIASLAYGSAPSLKALIHTQTAHALLYALAHLQISTRATLSASGNLDPPASVNAPGSGPVSQRVVQPPIGTPRVPSAPIPIHTMPSRIAASPVASSRIQAASSISSRPIQRQALTAALSRALRALTSALADIVGPSEYGLLAPQTPDFRGEAEQVLENVFCPDSLDIFLPLLSPPPPSAAGSWTSCTAITQTQIAIAHLLGVSLRAQSHRTAVATWVPSTPHYPDITSQRVDGVVAHSPDVTTRRGWETSEMSSGRSLDRAGRSPDVRVGRGWETANRGSEEPGKRHGRGWEKPTNSLTKQGGWVAKTLVGLLASRDVKVQEAALLALAALSKDDSTLAAVLSRPISGNGFGLEDSHDDHTFTPLDEALSLTKSRNEQVQIAACLCVTRIRRATTTSPPSSGLADDDVSARTVINVINRMLDISSGVVSAPHRTKACFILYHLITDDPAICQAAFDRGSLDRLATLVRSLSPIPGSEAQAWDEDEEPESISTLREAALTAIAALSLFSNDIRRAVTDDLVLLPTIQAALTHQHAGTRYAACQCVRALSRAVAVLRTNLVDSGLGMAVFAVLGKELGEDKDTAIASSSLDSNLPDENLSGDRRVLGAALAAVCNIVNEFSPLRPIFLEKGLMRLIMKVLKVGDSTLKVSALWAVKNLLRKSSTETKKDVMRSLGWDRITRYLSDSEKVQEQAYNVVRNLAEDEDGVSMVFKEMDSDVLLRHLTASLKSTDDNVVLQAAYTLANLSNGCESEQQDILSHPRLLEALRSCLAMSKTEIRRPVVGCILELVNGNPKRRKDIVEAGFVSTLKHICEWSGVVGSPGPVGAARRSTVLEDDRDVIDQARRALDWLEHGDAYILS